jgi:hypothetical protein
VFGGVYAPATLGQLLREFTHGHTHQLASAARAHLIGLAERTPCVPGIDAQCFVDIDSLLRPVYGHAKAGASFGHAKIAGRQVLRRGLSPLATTISTDTGAPLIAGIGLRAGKAGSGRGAASMVTEAINTARAAGASGEILVRGDSAYGSAAVIGAVRQAGVRFSLVLTKNPAVRRAIATITEDAWTPVHYPGAVLDPDTGKLISDAEVAEVSYTAFAASTAPVTARLIVRRVKDRNHLQELFPVWRHHPFFTNSTESVDAADITHRPHAIIETVFADLIDAPPGPPPLGPLLSQCRVGHLRSHHPQPAACGRHSDQPRTRRRTGGDPASQDRERTRTLGSAPTPRRAAPTRALALGETLDTTVEQRLRYRTRPTRTGLTPTHPPQGPNPEPDSGKAGSRPAASPRPTSPHRPERKTRSTTRSVHGSRHNRYARDPRWRCADGPWRPAREESDAEAER